MASTRAETDVRNLGREFRAVVEVADALERIGSLEQAKRDAEQAARAANESAIRAKAKSLEVLGELTAAEVKLDEAIGAAARVEAEAEVRVKERFTTAKKSADIILQQARDEREELRITVRKDREAHALYMEDVGRQHEQAQEALDVLNTELKALREKVGI